MRLPPILSFARLIQRRKHGLVIVEIGVSASSKAFVQSVERLGIESVFESPLIRVSRSALRQPQRSLYDIKIVAGIVIKPCTSLTRSTSTAKKRET